MTQAEFNHFYYEVMTEEERKTFEVMCEEMDKLYGKDYSDNIRIEGEER